MFFKRLKCLIFSAILFITLIPVQVLAEETNTGFPWIEKVPVEFSISGGMNGKIRIDSADIPFDSSQKYTYNIESGMDVVFEVIPNENYHISKVIINGVDKGVQPSNKYFIERISDKTTVEVTFAINQYTVSLNQTENGSISFTDGAGLQAKPFNHGDSPSINIKPDSGYQFDRLIYKDANGIEYEVLENDSSITDNQDGTYTCVKNNLTGNLVIQAEFKKIESITSDGIVIETPENYSSEDGKIIFSNKPVTIRVQRDKIKDIAPESSVSIVVIYAGGRWKKYGEEAQLWDNNATITDIYLIYKKTGTRKDGTYKVPIGGQKRLIRDTSSPLLNVKINDTVKPSYNSDIQMELTVPNANSIDVSGLKNIIYWFDSETPNSNATTVTNPKKDKYSDAEKQNIPTIYNFTIDATKYNGSKKLYVKAEFLNGESTTVTKDIDIDTVAPKVDLVYDNNNAQNGEYFNKERTATLTVTERSDHFDENTAKNNIVIKQFNGKGEAIAEPQYTIGEWNTTPGDTPDEDKHTIEIKYTGDAVYKFDFEYTDTAGNQNEPINADEQKAAFTFVVDKNKPTATIEATSDIKADNGSEIRESWSGLQSELTLGYFAKKNITFKLSADDETSAIANIYYYAKEYSNNEPNSKILTEAELARVSDWQEGDSFKLTEEGTYVVYVKAVDKAGNVTYVSSSGLIVDEKKPSIESTVPSITINPEASLNTVYNGDVKVNVHVSEPITNNSYSGLKKISYVVRNMGTQTQGQDDGVLFEAETLETLTLGDLIASKDVNFVVSSQLNNSNEVEIEVTVVDNAGNVSVKKQTIQIDTTAPVISVAYDNNNASEGKYFNAPRTATVTVYERNFNADYIEMQLKALAGSAIQISDWTHTAGTGNGDDAKHTATINYTVDDDYTFSIKGRDTAGNVFQGNPYVDGTVASEEFTIDQVRPTISVSYDNNNARNGNYYNAARTATITVVERNFDPQRVTATIANVSGTNGAPALSAWTDNGDSHTATITYSTDGQYQFDIDVQDRAGNAATDYPRDEFFIDLTKPQLEIRDIVDQSANKGRVAPVIQYSDANFDPSTVEITLTGAMRGRVENKGFYTEIQNGQIYTYYDFANVKEEDDIYTLTAKITDKAGNTEEKQITFSVNRFGSTYGFDENTKAISGKYVREVGDIVIYETNVDPVDNVKITLFKNNKTVVLEKGKDYQVIAEGGNGKWYHYTYRINRSLFTDDAVYSITLYSEDKAGNVSENTLDTKKMSLRFGVDNTTPSVTFKNIDKNKVYVGEKYKAEIKLADNLALSKAEIYLDGKLVATLDQAQLEELIKNGGDYTLEIDSADYARNVKIVLTDAAGNTIEEEIDNFFVTTNLWVRFVNNRPVFAGTLATLLSGFAIFFFILWKRRKKEEEEK